MLNCQKDAKGIYDMASEWRISHNNPMQVLDGIGHWCHEARIQHGLRNKPQFSSINETNDVKLVFQIPRHRTFRYI